MTAGAFTWANDSVLGTGADDDAVMVIRIHPTVSGKVLKFPVPMQN